MSWPVEAATKKSGRNSVRIIKSCAVYGHATIIIQWPFPAASFALKVKLKATSSG